MSAKGVGWHGSFSRRSDKLTVCAPWLSLMTFSPG
jgi:hypothetical protein